MRLVTRSTLTIAALTFTASAAEAATTDANRSRGTADLSWSTRTPIVGPASNKIGGSALQVQLSADLDPLEDTTKPLLAVAMKDVAVEAMWNDKETIDLFLADNKLKDGSVKVEHTLAPHVKLFIDAFGFNLTYDYNAESLIDQIPGSSWNYVGTGSTTFEPWAIKNYGIVNVQGPLLTDARLFSMPLSDLIGSGSTEILTGDLAFNATTSPTFNYGTTEVVLDNGTPITKDKPTYTIKTTDADFLDVPMIVKGQITYSGNLFARPTVTITKIGNFSLPLPLTLDIDAAGVELPYESGEAPIPVTFQVVKVHIPLPNVKAGKTLDLGSSLIGEGVTKQSEIKNTGELEAVLSIKSSDPQFKVVSDKVMKAKDKLELDVTFTPDKEGEQSADITVTSNDPNEPVQVIKVTGVGTKAAEPPPAPPTDPNDVGMDPHADNGCGCRTAPAPSGYAAFGAVGLALGAILRRRRR
jgi:MYXO-CTERM domain-containing protein